MGSPMQFNSASHPHEGFMKGSFGYRMSKKVAELTQVVHMLFTKNHEREAEIDETKQRYARDMTRIVKVARGALEKADYQIRELERHTQRQKDHVAENTAQLLKDSQEKIELLKSDLTEEKAENHRLRDSLTQNHIDINRMKQGSTGATQKLVELTQQLNKSLSDVKRYKTLFEAEQETNKNQQKNLLDLSGRLKAKEEEFQHSQDILEKTNTVLDDRNNRVEELSHKVQRMEQEIKLLRRESIKQGKGKPKALTEKSSDMFGSRSTDVFQEELERKNKEIERLRMELSNREGNFNRVFAKFQPVLVSPETRSVASDNSKILMMTSPVEYTDRNPSRPTLPSITGLEFDSDNYILPRQLVQSSEGLPRHTSAKAKLMRSRAKPISPKVRLIFTK